MRSLGASAWRGMEARYSVTAAGDIQKHTSVILALLGGRYMVS